MAQMAMAAAVVTAAAALEVAGVKVVELTAMATAPVCIHHLLTVL